MTLKEAVKRITFQLTYSRSRIRRKFSGYGISGPMIANSYRAGKAPGGWDDLPLLTKREDRIERDDGHEFEELPRDWTADFFTWAVKEAIHEALEWFQVDGKPFFDPHGKHLGKMMVACDDFARKFYREFAVK